MILSVKDTRKQEESASGGGEIWQSLGKFQIRHWDQHKISKFKNWKITFHRGIAARCFKRPLLEARYPLKFFHREKVGFHFPVNLRKTAVYTDDSVTFSCRHSSLGEAKKAFLIFEKNRPLNSSTILLQMGNNSSLSSEHFILWGTWKWSTTFASLKCLESTYTRL